MFPFSVKQKQHEAENISIQLSHFSLESFNVAATVAKQTQRELKNIIGSGGVLLKDILKFCLCPARITNKRDPVLLTP